DCERRREILACAEPLPAFGQRPASSRSRCCWPVAANGIDRPRGLLLAVGVLVELGQDFLYFALVFLLFSFVSLLVHGKGSPRSVLCWSVTRPYPDCTSAGVE